MRPRMIEVPDSSEEINALACERGWSDGLPIVPPTEDRVQRVLGYLKRDPNEVVATLPPRMGAATVLHIAINAVMAGCLPEYVPVVIAAIEAVADPKFNLQVIETDGNPAAPLTIVNGPVRKSIKMNWGRNALGHGNRANATIGRAVRLCLLNIGGAKPGKAALTLLGQPGRYVFCLAEDEDGNPWEPLHVERGFSTADSTVTVVGATGTINVLCGTMYNVRDMLTLMASAMSYMGSNNVLVGDGEPMAVLTRGHAEILRREGLSKADVKQLLYEKAGFPSANLPPTKRRERIEAVEKNGRIRPARRPEDIMVLVAGGPETHHAMVIPTLGDTCAITSRVRMP